MREGQQQVFRVTFPGIRNSVRELVGKQADALARKFHETRDMAVKDELTFISFIAVVRYLDRETLISVLTSIVSSMRKGSEVVFDFDPPRLCCKCYAVELFQAVLKSSSTFLPSRLCRDSSGS